MASSDSSAASSSIAAALKELNAKWFSELKPRWVDIIGSYAGTELFLVDGDALIQTVLDDPLLQLGRKDSTDWQILHALYSVEAFLHDLTKRGAVFHVAFFETNGPLAIGTSKDAWISSSRSLAHKILKGYIQSLELETYEFEDLDDEDWKSYVLFNKPLFILSNDHAVTDEADQELREAANLLHETFIKDMLEEGLLMASLREVDFRDSQVNTFLYNPETKIKKLSKEASESISKAVAQARTLLDKHVPKVPDSDEDDEDDEAAEDVESWPVDAIQHYANSNTPTPHHLALIYAFLAHSLLLRTIDLDLRSQPAVSLDPALSKTITEEFLPTLFLSIEATAPNDIDEPPLIDGRIFSHLLAALLQPDANPTEILGQGVHNNLTDTWKELELSAVDFGALAQRLQQGPLRSGPTNPSEFREFSLYPFDSNVFQGALDEVDVPAKAIDDFGGVPPPLHEFDSDSVYRPSRHRQTYRSPIPKHLGGDDPKPKDVKAKRKALRQNQRFMANLERQANSLTGAKGAKLEAEVIAPNGISVGAPLNPAVVALSGSRSSSRPDSPDTKGAKGKRLPPAQAQAAQGSTTAASAGSAKGKAGKKGKEPPMKSADKLRAQIATQKNAKATSDSESWWRGRLEEWKNITELTERMEMIDLQLKSNRRVEADTTLAANVWLYRINCECWHWIENPSRTEKDVKDGYIIRLLKMVKGMKDYTSVLTPTMVKCLWSVLEAIGFGDYVTVIPKPAKEATDKKLEFDFIKFYKKHKTGSNAGQVIDSYPWMAIREDPVDWQLRVFGEHMDRSFDSQPDPRVKFEPDKWQRDVLDKLDQDESVLVVAPTSAGKTFISYYAMKQVLTSSDDGILVYVAPTKALVTQITAEVYARYRKDLKGRSCWAIYTQDTRMNNPQTCQILVTVPETLAYMLLSPVLAKLWTPRIKRIILDEIHTLGTQPGGVWEQIILLARCPIIGLSATVGEAEAFNEWLKTVQEAHGHVHTLVQHHHRYSHLRKFAYTLDDDPEPMDGLPTHKASSHMRFLHPISFLRPGIQEMPSDLALEARDCATLYKAMAEHSKDSSVAKLKPTKFFEKQDEAGIFLQQKDIIRYEEALKAKLTEWLRENNAHEPTSTIQKVVKSLTDKEAGSEESEQLLRDPKQFSKNLLNLLADLHASGDLPALLFHFDRYHVEAIARAILERLQHDENEWRKVSPEWKKRVEGWEAWQAGAKDREKAAQRAALKKDKAEGDKMERMMNAASVDSSPLAIYANFDPDAPAEEFTFINWASKFSPSELDEEIKSLERYTTTPRFLLDGLRRGVAIHHSGLSKAYRTLVESLFRIGFIRVVVSTEELALGVNMPAKAAIFCGDSPALTALMYRQCAGRAGRRGFDLLGKVIFYGIPHARVKQVVLSKLPALRGNYPLTPTLSLRLVNLLTDSGYAPTATLAVRDLLKLDHLTIGSDISRDQTLYNLRFSLEYLIRARLLNSMGEPQYPWYSFASFLYTTEPANLAFLSLYRSGFIHSVCNDPNIVTAKLNLMQLLSFLFCRDYLSKTNFDKELFAINNRTPSKVVLPALGSEAYRVLKEHNNEVVTVFTESAIMYAIQHADTLGSDNTLPLSGRAVEVTSTPTASTFIQNLKRSRLSVRSRSAFVATSGHGDVYKDIDELVRTVRSGVNLTKPLLPFLDVYHPDDQEGRYINAYLWDFYNHGQDKPIVEANNIPKGDIWYRLLDFSYTLDSIVTAIKELMIKDHRRHDDDVTSIADTESVAGGVGAASGPQDDWLVDLEKDEAVISGGGPDAGGPLEKERGDDAEATLNTATGREAELTRAMVPHVSDRDWRVYDVFLQLQIDFTAKFKAMWA